MSFKEKFGPNVAVIGASNDRTKFGNKAVRAFVKSGYNVFPINLNEKAIEGIKAYTKISDITDKIDFVSIYLPPNVSLASNIPMQLKAKRVKGVILNPGSDDEELIKKLKDLKIHVLAICSIQALGSDPSEL